MVHLPSRQGGALSPRPERNLHKALSRAVIWLGSDNPVVRAYLRSKCSRYGAKLHFRENAIDVCRDGGIIRISAKHFVYAEDMARSFTQYFSQVVPTTSGQGPLVDYSQPRLQRYTRTGLDFETASFPEEAEALDGYCHWYQPKKGDTVFDLGAYCGVSAYYFSKLVGREGRVYAFEPDSLSFELLNRNIKRHRLDNVTAVQTAVAATTGTARYCSEGTLGSSLQHQLSRATVGHVTDVSTLSLEEACTRYGMPSLVKMDVEGSEIEIISAARKFISGCDINFTLDTNHWVEGRRTNTAIEALFAECGYESKSSEDFGFMTTWARKIRK